MKVMKKYFIPLVFFLGLGTFGAFVSLNANAQTSESSLAISPLTFEITANPGDVVTNAVRLFNPSDGPVTIVMQVEDFAAQGEGGQAIIEEPETTAYSIATWTSLAKNEFVLGSNEVGLVDFTLAVPANAEPGGHYGAITAEARAGAVTGNASSAVAMKVAALMLVSVSGSVQEQLSIVDFAGPSGAVLDAGAITLTSRFENSGTVHLKPRGFVTITDTFGREVANISLDQRNVLPNSKRIVETSWQPEGFTMGRMRAQLAAIYGSANEPLVASVEFWVIPMNVVGPVLAVSTVVLVLGFVLRKRLTLAFAVLFSGSGRKPQA